LRSEAEQVERSERGALVPGLPSVQARASGHIAPIRTERARRPSPACLSAADEIVEIWAYSGRFLGMSADERRAKIALARNVLFLLLIT